MLEMSVRTSRNAAVVATMTVAVGLLGMGVAHAEGGFDSSIGGWFPGKESRHWHDLNHDAARTTVRFSGCKVDGASRFISATIQLKKERRALPDPVIARDNNTCETSNFGRQGENWYYFNLSRINGGDGSGIRLGVEKVNVRY
ncbi:hypothetical protein [Streptomyces cucumeris]|uniref:hypothetical protein n=1 Tax=Streptomyces cucumeris TaxID=2962890 RepID=UPI0020C93937|nr:hypothetical protein [Streptomyces sp. NEAU-Y11]MCP9208756.1 hypothetical protein [Streptomyces sp. NEAU-Y11]